MVAHKDLIDPDIHEPKGISDATSGQVYSADGAGSGAWTSLSTITIPVGMVTDYAGSSAPSGWVLCYGQAISRTTYASLFAAISTTYGSGDGSTTFNVPDCRGRVSAGQDDMGGVSANRLTGLSNGVDGDTLGATGGLESFTLAEANLPAHTHGPGTLGGTTSSDGNHTHDYTDSSDNGAQASAGSARNVGTQTDNTSSDGAHTHTFTVTTGTTGSTGSTTAMPHIQPTIVLNKIIYTGV